MKKITSILLSMIMLLSCLSAGIASAAEFPVVDGIIYKIENGEAVVHMDDSKAVLVDVVIPSEVKGYPVTAISGGAFYENTDLKSVVIPDTVKLIDSYAFSWCENLESVVIGNGVTKLGAEAFSWCDNLTDITFGNSLLEIGDNAFYSTPHISTIPDTVTTIGAYAYDSCESATINIPASVTSIDIGAFCSFYTETITVDSANPNYSSQDGVLFNKDKTTLIQYPCGKTGEYTVPQSVTTIADEAFQYCSLTRVTVSENVTSIGDSAFYSSDLQVVIIENRNCEIADDSYTIRSNATIYGYPNSTAQAYAEKYNKTFVALASDLNGWVEENGKWAYYVNGSKIVNDWMLDSVGWCYLGSDGYMVTNSWIMDSVGWCYVGADGYCLTDCWMADSVGWCYLDSEGRMATNQWILDSVGWCYVGADGYCITNSWVKDSIGWCYLDADGRMVYNTWVQDSYGWCYVGASGYMVYDCWIGNDYIGSDGYWVA